ncbi:MAG: hypothetical protein C3F19_05075 [Rhodocyclales bacterium]|jgi:uncharacterized membrane protein YjjB (DUF3815 family)|nr:hypothetical protein [Rhodocyclaceae bacterium]PWB42139.1 MAG: hypothetical protein C3F19_05075 [Rhodocyclales bacterium]
MYRFFLAPVSAVGFALLAYLAWQLSAVFWSGVMALCAWLSFACLVKPKSHSGQAGLELMAVVALVCAVLLMDDFFDGDC